MNKIKKYIGILIFIIIAGISIYSNAASSPGWIYIGDGVGYGSTTTNQGDKVFCVELGAPLKGKTLKDNLPKLYNGGAKYCNTCSPFGATGRPAAGTNGDIGYTTEFTNPTIIDYTKHQDVAYALAFAEGANRQEKIQTVIWKSSLDASGGSDETAIRTIHTTEPSYISDEGLFEEATAYKEFYEEKEAAGGYNPTDETVYDDVKVVANQEDDTYTVGKFSIKYIKGIYKSGEKVVKFGYITEIKLTNEHGEKLEIVDILTENGESIMEREDYGFPDSEEEFYIKFKAKASTSKVRMSAYFRYLDVCEASMTKWEGNIYEWGYVKVFTGSKDHSHCTYHPDTDEEGNDTSYYTHENCKVQYYYELKKAPYSAAQDLLTVTPIGVGEMWANPIWKETDIEGEKEIDITMELGGIVFLDIPEQKDTTKVNGMYDKDFDKILENIEVTLYEDNGNLAVLEQENGELRTNPTLTDANGHYEFKGMDAQKKYYVTYKINGQYLENTKYRVIVSEYNSDEWNRSSKATILDADRTAYNTKFEHIGSSPSNYTTINNITGFNLSSNKTYNIYDQTYDKAQQEKDDIVKLQEEINKKIHEYINSNSKYPDNAAKTAIYQQVANENSSISEVINKIQYIVDIEVIATTGYKAEMQYYPVYDKFVIDDEELEIDETYKPIYEGQKHINFGTIEREIFDLKLAKDIYEIKVTINGKEYIYHYNGRNQEAVEVEVRGSDLAIYERDLRESDIGYIDYINNDEKKLRVYITYKIRITNQSNSQLTSYITKLYDHYDADYTFLNSHVVKYNEQGIESDNVLNWNNDEAAHKLTTEDQAISSLPINVSEYIDVYNQFEVTTEALKRLIEEKESTKENYAEIGGYKTYYTTQRKFDDNDIINEAGYVAGLVDRDSRAGDFEVTDKVKEFVNYTYTDEFKNKDGETKTKESLTVFQDDADKAPGLKLILLTIMREINGNVWEDSTIAKLLEEENIRRGDGINNEGSPIEGMKVELVSMDEELALNNYPYNHTRYNRVSDIYNIDEKKFKPAVTYTAEDGTYQFKGYIPGNYLIRYTYGEGRTLTTDANGKVYNGQDYKSTLYAEENHNVGTVEEPNYWYNVEDDDKSDAHDNYSLRNTMNANNSTMNNHIATVLDYKVASGDINSDPMLKELQDTAMMYAETNKLVLEVEYAKRDSSYTENVQEYKVNNIDFGITERPRSELTLIKDVKNIRIISNDGQTIFDAEEQATNLSWMKPSTVPYRESHGLIQAIMDENLMHGSTVKILYDFTIKNTGEKDYIDENGNIDISFYNTGVITGKVVTTRASYIIDYVEENLKFSPDAELDNIDKDKGYNQYWVEIPNKEELNPGNNDRLVNVDIDILNSYTTIIKATDNSPLLQELKPADEREKDGDSATTTLLLTKVLNTESEDTLMYNNAIEIVQVKNQAGRRSYNNRDRSEYEKDQVSDAVISIPGNYNPTTVSSITAMSEPDSDLAETVVILNAFGEENKVPFIIGTIIAVVVLAGGIYLIKKKVIR